MKILLANKFFYLKGGAERVFFQERQFLLDNYHEVVDFSMADTRNLPSMHAPYFVSNRNYQGPMGLSDKIRLGAQFIHSAEAVRKIDALVRAERPHIAHLHNIYHQLTPSIIPVLKSHGVRVVLTLHDYKLVCPSYLMLDKGMPCTACTTGNYFNVVRKNCKESWIQGLLLMAEAYWHVFRGSYGMVDVFLAPSAFMATMAGRRVPKEKIVILRNGIRIDEFSPSNADKGYAVYCGRLSPEKGAETLLKAHVLLNGTFPLKVVGTGPMEEELKARYPKAEFVGYKQGHELSELMRNASFVVVPSEVFENCSMAVLEAMALGKPVIASRMGGILEQMEDTKTGLLFECGNVRDLAAKMRTLAENPGLRASYGKAGRVKAVRDCNLMTHCRGLMEIYQGLVS